MNNFPNINNIIQYNNQMRAINIAINQVIELRLLPYENLTNNEINLINTFDILRAKQNYLSNYLTSKSFIFSKCTSEGIFIRW